MNHLVSASQQLKSPHPGLRCDPDHLLTRPPNPYTTTGALMHPVSQARQSIGGTGQRAHQEVMLRCAPSLSP